MDAHTTMQKKLSDLNTMYKVVMGGCVFSFFRGKLVYIRHMSVHLIGPGQL